PTHRLLRLLSPASVAVYRLSAAGASGEGASATVAISTGAVAAEARPSASAGPPKTDSKNGLTSAIETTVFLNKLAIAEAVVRDRSASTMIERDGPRPS